MNWQGKRYHVRFRDVDSCENYPVDSQCWHYTFKGAEAFAIEVAWTAYRSGVRLESAIFKDGELVHEHGAPRELVNSN